MRNRRPPGKITKWIKFILLAFVLAAVVYWLRFSPLAVTGHPVTRGEITAEVMGTGTLEARLQTIVSSKIAGRISDVPVDQGDEVQEGQVLLRLDDSELKQQVEIARSSLAAANASIERVEAEAERAQAVLDQVKVDHQRNQKLFASKSISANEMDKSEQALEVAQADLAKSRAAVAEARKNLIVAQNTLDYQLARLGDTVIKAPFSGLIIRRDREPGDVVVPGTSIFLLISPKSLWVRAWVDETEMADLKIGQEARVIFRSEPGTNYTGKVARLGRETDRETRQFLVDVDVEKLPRNWSVGQRAEVFIETAGRKGTVTIPSRLLLRQDGTVGVFTLAEGKAAWIPLKIGLRGRENVEILEGLEPGDMIITTSGSKKIHEGRRVKVTSHEPRR